MLSWVILGGMKAVWLVWILESAYYWGDKLYIGLVFLTTLKKSILHNISNRWFNICTDKLYLTSSNNYYLQYISIFYNISIKDPTNVTSVTIRVETVSGSMSVCSSQMYDQPTFEDIWKNDSDVLYLWNGTATYWNQLDKPIYVSIMGESEGLYRISYVVGRN